MEPGMIASLVGTTVKAVLDSQGPRKQLFDNSEEEGKSRVLPSFKFMNGSSVAVMASSTKINAADVITHQHHAIDREVRDQAMVVDVRSGHAPGKVP